MPLPEMFGLATINTSRNGLSPIEGIFEGAKFLNLYIDDRGMAKWAIFIRPI